MKNNGEGDTSKLILNGQHYLNTKPDRDIIETGHLRVVTVMNVDTKKKKKLNIKLTNEIQQH